jgi:hypothetical protein
MRLKLENADGSCLRFIFHEAVIAVRLADDATIEDVARILGGFTNRRYGNPVAIDVTMQSRKTVSYRRKFSDSISAWPRIVSRQYSANEQHVSTGRLLQESESAESANDAE